MRAPRRHQVDAVVCLDAFRTVSRRLRGGRACAEGGEEAVAGFDEGFEHFGCAAAGPLLIDNTYRALADHHLEG